MGKISVAQEIEAYCGKCKNDTLHVITAVDDDKIEKVMCKVCMSYHKYKQPQSASAKPAAKKTQKKTATATKPKRRTRRDKWTRLLDNTDSDAAIEYKMDKDYELATAIHHKNFGLGVVKNIIDSRKIEVLFHDGAKILVQNMQV